MSRWIETDVTPYYPEDWLITFTCKKAGCRQKTQLSYARIETWQVCDVDCWACWGTSTYQSVADLSLIADFKAQAEQEHARQRLDACVENKDDDADFSEAWVHPSYRRL